MARIVSVRIGKVSFTATLRDTAAADRVWAALPLFSVAETWGAAVHFEVPLESGRERGATQLATAGSLYFWSDEHRIILVYGPTPLSADGAWRLPVPCNAWADTDWDLTPLANVVPGQKVSLTRVAQE